MHRSLLAREENDNVWCMLASVEGRECISGSGH